MANGRFFASALIGCSLVLQAGTAWAAQSFQDLRAQQLEDIAVFSAEVLDRDRSYTPRARASAVQLLDRLRRDSGKLNRATFALRLGEIVALARNGHTEQKSGPLRQQMNRSPIHYFVGSDGAFVVDSQVKSVPVGAQVKRLGKLSIEQIQDRLARYAAGNRGHREWMLYTVLESPELLHALGATEAPDRFSITLAGNKPIWLRAMPADPADAENWWGDRELALASRARAPAPLYLKEPARGYRFEVFPDQSLAYIQFRQNHDDSSGETISDFTSRVAAGLKQQKPCFVIVDQRLNYGGDLNLTRGVMQMLPQLIAKGGHVYAITGGKTFSAGVSSLGYLKQAAGARLTIVGQEIGDDLDFWAEGDRVSLPNSGLMFGFATERHTYARPCREQYCHGSIVEHPIIVSDLKPQVPVPLKYRDYERGLDRSFAWVRDDLQRRRSGCTG